MYKTPPRMTRVFGIHGSSPLLLYTFKTIGTIGSSMIGLGRVPITIQSSFRNRASLCCTISNRYYIVDTNSSGKSPAIDFIDYKIMLKVEPCNTIIHRQRVVICADGPF